MLLELASLVLPVGLLAPGGGRPFPVGERPPLGAWPGERPPLGGICPPCCGGARPWDPEGGGGKLAEVGEWMPVDMVDVVGEWPGLFLRGVGVRSASKLRVLCW
jgi:hypothetical protein